MKRTRTGTTAPGLGCVSALCVAIALVLAVFYHGPQLGLLAGAQFMLVAWLALSFGAQYADGVRLPLTPLGASVALFWGWLAVSLGWSGVPATSVMNFWWVGSFAFVFWCYTLSADRSRVWFYAARFVLAGALALCLYALVQRFAWREPPRATFINIHSFAALLMLVALPLAGHFVSALQRRANARVVYGIGGSLFVLVFTIAVTEGRGTALSLLLGAGVLVFLARSVGVRPLVALVGLLVGAYLAANLLLHGSFDGNRLATLADPASAGAPRFLIWRGSWEMLKAHPWFGIGLGTYYLAWPPYRSPADTSLGFFVHNDYLQLWIETGLPALLLLLGVLGSALWMLVRLVRHPQLDVDVAVETAGLFAGLVAVAAHSFVDFNFYILPTSILAGLVLGRFHECATQAVPLREWRMRPARILQARAYRLIVILLALFPASYFVALGLSDHFYKRGFALALQGDLEQADHSLGWAETLMPSDEKVRISHADLYRHVLERLPAADRLQRRSLYDSALSMLDQAESANPYRALTHVVRARILAENRDLSGPTAASRAEAEYQRALALDPRGFQSRQAYAQLLLANGRSREAYRLLDGGLHYWYYPGTPVLAYYDDAARVARQLGYDDRAAEIDRLKEAMRRELATMVPARPLAPDPSVPISGSTERT